MTDQTTPEPMADEETLPLAFSDQARRLLAEVDRLRAQLDRAKAAAAWERGQRRSQSSTLGVKIDQLGIARAEKAALAARLAEAEQARDEARAEATRQRHEREKYTERWDALDLQRLAALRLHNTLFCEVRNDHGPCKTRRILDGDGVTARTGCGTCGACRAHEPATATGAPGPDPSEGTAPTSPQEPTQAAVDTIARILVGTDWDEEVPYTDIGPRETVARLARRIIAATHEAEGAPERVDTTTAPGGAAPGPAPLTLAQAAGHLHDWARDLTDGTNTSYPHGHPSVIRGIRAAADWLDARSAYETEARDARAARLIGLIGGADG